MQGPNSRYSAWQVCHCSIVGSKRSLKRSALARGAIGVQMRPASVSVARERQVLVVDVDLCCCLCYCYWSQLWRRLMLAKSGSSDEALVVVTLGCVNGAGVTAASTAALVG